jgi:quercetin dioxygenase-like cupin family protein
MDHLTGATIELAKVEKGATFPAHYHTTLQTLFLLSGRLRTGNRLIEPGTFNVIPPGTLHGPFLAEEEAIQFKYFSAVPVYILEDGTTYIYKRDGRTVKAGALEFTRGLTPGNFILGH